MKIPNWLLTHRDKQALKIVEGLVTKDSQCVSPTSSGEHFWYRDDETGLRACVFCGKYARSENGQQ